jgi:hypothetical protein
MPTIDLGDPVPNLAVETRDDLGALADAGSVSLVITKPDNSTITVTPSHDDVGKYSASYFPTDPGHYNVRWVATGVNTSAYSDSFDVLEANPRYIVSLSDAKELLRFQGTTTADEELRRYNQAATDMIERYLDQIVVRRPVIGEEHFTGRSLYYSYAAPSYPSARVVRGIYLNKRPVLSLASVATLDGLYTWDVSQLIVNSETAEVKPLPGAPNLWGNIVVDYVAGYQIIPANIQEAARIIIQHLWATRRGLGGNLITQQLPGFNIGFALPQTVKDLLGEQPPVFA